MVIGASNSGKTTLISFLLMNCLKFQDLKILSFDSFSGTKVPVTAFGGEYTDVKTQSSFNLNPFLLEDTYANRQF
jgi:type IV secretion system protein VirB4/ComB4 competence protein